jgi:hypothetical protein
VCRRGFAALFSTGAKMRNVGGEGDGRYTYNAVIKACARPPQDTVKRDALSCVLPRMEHAGVEPDLFTYTALVKAFGLYRQGPAVQEVMVRMHRTDFQVRATLGLAPVAGRSQHNGGGSDPTTAIQGYLKAGYTLSGTCLT